MLNNEQIGVSAEIAIADIFNISTIMILFVFVKNRLLVTPPYIQPYNSNSQKQDSNRKN